MSEYDAANLSVGNLTNMSVYEEMGGRVIDNGCGRSEYNTPDSGEGEYIAANLSGGNSNSLSVY